MSARSAPSRYVTGLYVAIVENHPVSSCLWHDGVGEEEQGKEDHEARIDSGWVSCLQGDGIREST